MRTISTILGFLSLSSVLLVASQTIRVTPQTLDGWSGVVPGQAAFSPQSELTVPAGGQLAHAFATRDIVVELTSRPAFAEASGDWPVLEIGPAALVFARNGTAGQLLLIQGENEPEILLSAIALDADGRSREPLALVFGRIGDILTVGINNQEFVFPAAEKAPVTAEVVASAGAGTEWRLSVLTVTVDVADAGASGQMPWQTDKNIEVKAAGAEQVDRGMPTGIPETIVPVATAAAVSKNSAAVKPADPAGGLEIYTPSAVRHGRAGAVRAAVVESKQK